MLRLVYAGAMHEGFVIYLSNVTRHPEYHRPIGGRDRERPIGNPESFTHESVNPLFAPQYLSITLLRYIYNEIENFVFSHI